MQSQVSQRVDWFHPGEVVIIARVARDASSQDQLHATVRDLLGRHASQHVAPDPGSLRSFVFSAPQEDSALAFLFQELVSADSIPTVKGAVEALQGQIGNLRTNQVDVLGVMPHWHTRAHEMSSGGSPGSLPAPVPPGTVRRGARRWRYQPGPDSLRQTDGRTPIPIAVLDTRIDLANAQRRGEQLRTSGGTNEQLLETVTWLQQHDVAPGAPRQREWNEVARHHAAPDPDEPKPYLMPDHALFVSGLIHGLAPQSPLTLLPALDETGSGDLSLLLAALRDVLDRKQPDAPQIINLSLGFRPHPAHLAAAWHGFDLSDATYQRATVMFDENHDQRWAASHAHEVARRSEQLQAGLSELGRYLSLNNCLVVAAAGNDSEPGEARLEPRLPARFETVLGVAATTHDPKQPASYSNVGDERRLGDHVATFGGDRGAAFEPRDGVVGIYSGEFPPQRTGQAAPDNATGWAYWSGTSFATALVSGIAANVWATRPTAHASEILADIHSAAVEAGAYVPALRTPSIAISGDWD
jgi:hypothetical protein